MVDYQKYLLACSTVFVMCTVVTACSDSTAPVTIRAIHPSAMDQSCSPANQTDRLVSGLVRLVPSAYVGVAGVRPSGSYAPTSIEPWNTSGFGFGECGGGAGYGGLVPGDWSPDGVAVSWYSPVMCPDNYCAAGSLWMPDAGLARLLIAEVTSHTRTSIDQCNQLLNGFIALVGSNRFYFFDVRGPDAVQYDVLGVHVGSNPMIPNDPDATVSVWTGYSYTLNPSFNEDFSATVLHEMGHYVLGIDDNGGIPESLANLCWAP